MKTKTMLFFAGALAAGATGAAAAQSNVTIYGIADAAMVYANQAGGSNVYMRSGNLGSSRLGFKGLEDIGNGTQVVFVLESGFDLDSGAQSSAGVLFNRQAYVGLTNKDAGSVTVGRQYTAYYQMVGPVGPTGVLTGATGAHPGDIDGLDVTIRSSNSAYYASPNWGGLKLGLSAAAGEQAGHTGVGGTLSAALKYDVSNWNFALGYQLLKNGPNQTTWDTASSSSFAKSPLNAGYLSAESVQYLAAAARYQMDQIGFGAILTSVKYEPNGTSLFRDAATFNTAGLHTTYQLSNPWFFSAGVSYTRENAANGISDPANYRQLSLEQTYSLSKRTAIYFVQAYQKARGMTLGAGGRTQVAAVAVVGDSQNNTPSPGDSQRVFMLGLRHSF